MATTLYFKSNNSTDIYYRQARGANNPLQDGFGVGRRHLGTTRGSAATYVLASPVNGPTSGIAFGVDSYITPPLSADVTISGSITFNLRALETSMSTNAAINAAVYKVSATDNSTTLVIKTTYATELTTSEAASNFSATPTSTAFTRGDRILVIPFIDDASGVNMGATGQAQFYFNGPTAGASGDSYVTFTENLTFDTTAPSGTTIYLTDTSAGINPGSATEYEAWTSRGSGATTSVTNTAAGPTAGIQTTDSAGGTAVEWYTKPLTAFTLSGPVFVNAPVGTSYSQAQTTVRCQIARVDGDGSNATVWGMGGAGTDTSSNDYIAVTLATETPAKFWVAGDDLSISNGQRLRIVFYIDDASPSGNMATGYAISLGYNGPNGGETGDAYLTFSNTLTEYSAATTYNGTFTANANIAKNDIAGSFTANANISKTDIAGSFTANAYVRKNDIAGTFTADATITKTTSGTFTADAFIKNTLSGTFTADAYVQKTLSGSFTADAYVSKTTSGSFTADAFVSKTTSGTFTADAYVSKTTSGTFTADAYIQRTFVYGVGGGGTVASENFEGSGGTGLAGTTAETGGDWSNVTGTLAYITLSGSGTANYLGSVNTSGRARLNSVVLGNGDAVWLNGGGTGSYAGVILRYKTDSDTGYGWEGHNDNEGNGDWNLFRLNSGSATNIGSGYIYNSGVDVSLPYWIRMRVEGSSPTLIKVKVWQDGSSEPGSWNVVDTSDNTAGNQVTSAAVGITISRESYFGSGNIAQFDVTADGGSVDGTGPTVDAYIQKNQTGSFTANAFIKNTLSGTFTADAHIASTVAGSVTADAYISKTVSGSFTADAEISTGTTYTGSFTADAYVSKTTSGSLTADAYVKNTISSSITADAHIKNTLSGSFTADAYVSKTTSGAFTADAHIKNTISGSLTADAYIAKTYSGSFSADAIVQKTTASTFTADATIAKTYSGSVTADAYVLKTLSGSVTADAYVLKTTSGAFTADAHISKTVSGTFTADAVVAKQYSGSFTADALVKNTLAASFTADATIAKTTAGTFTADAYIKQTLSGSLTAEAYILKTIAGSVTADAYVKQTSGSTFSADANIKNTLSGSFTADAYVQRVEQGTFTADATIQKTQSGTFTVDAYISKVGRIVWTTPGDTDAITSTPTFAFRIPPATGNIHFHIELDTVNTFDGASYRSYKSAFDQTGWEYHNGSTWVAVPATGVPNTYAGNEARYTVQTALANATWYRRVRGGV